MNDKVKRAKAAVEAAETRMGAALEALDSAADDITDEDLDSLNREFEDAESEVARSKKELDREERIALARANMPAPAAGGSTVTVGDEEPVYRRDKDVSFFADMLNLRNGDREASERLHRNNKQVAEIRKQRGELRANADGSGFQPPIYLADEWVKIARPGRPFANAVPKMGLPPGGTSITVPKVSTGTSVGFHADGGNVSDTAAATTTISSSLYAIAGQNEVDRLVLERSYPGLDMVIFDDLMRLYDQTVDQKLINGSGTAEYLGLENVSSINTVAGTVTSQKSVLQDFYKAISLIWSTRYTAPTAILMHPRRAAWLASGFDSTFPIFNQGGMNAFQAASQDGGLAGEIAGLRVIVDANVPTTDGAGTNEDPVFVLVMEDLRLAEEGVQQATFEEVASATLAIRLQLWGYSAALLNRYPKGICKITGYTAPRGF